MDVRYDLSDYGNLGTYTITYQFSADTPDVAGMEEYKRRNSIPAAQDCFAKSDYEHGIAGFWYFDWFINVLYKCVAMIFPTSLM